MNKEEIVRLHVFIDGHVQGVGFRYYVLEIVRNLDITGWVKNTYQEQVEVIAEGSRPTLEKLLYYLKRGPRSAIITQVTQEWKEATGEYSNFKVRYPF